MTRIEERIMDGWVACCSMVFFYPLIVLIRVYPGLSAVNQVLHSMVLR